MRPALPPNQSLAAPDRWPSVGEKEPRASAKPWTVTVSGLVDHPRVWTLEQLRDLPQIEAVIDIHCVTRWSRLGERFGGVLLGSLLARSGLRPEARFVSLVARSERNHSTSLPIGECLELGTLVALTYAGVPLEKAHGGPVRIVTPGKYFYKSLKWLERIDVLAEDRLGYWEAEIGYHNSADPWLEERYIAPNIDPKVLREVLASRDFSSRDLRGIEVRGRDLTRLSAVNALLRDSDFRGANLQNARFNGVNLSNARLQRADLRGASFTGADLEGADFRGADLRGADFTAASVLGATFASESGDPDEYGPALIDGETQIPEAILNQLLPEQERFVRNGLAGHGASGSAT